MSERIRLSATELMVAAYVGAGRNVQATLRRYQNKTGLDDEGWGSNIEGVGGEIAVGKFLNLYWKPIIGDPDADDVGPYQVRCNMSRKHTDTCLRPHDKPDRVYISVLSFMPEYEVIGWVWGNEGKQAHFLRDGKPGGNQCYYVPIASLHPMSELPPISELLALIGK